MSKGKKRKIPPVCIYSQAVEEPDAYYGAPFFALMDYLVEFTGECIVNHRRTDLFL